MNFLLSYLFSKASTTGFVRKSNNPPLPWVGTSSELVVVCRAPTLAELFNLVAVVHSECGFLTVNVRIFGKAESLCHSFFILFLVNCLVWGVDEYSNEDELKGGSTDL